jgi:pimeloyl-ACP methyl ester carboxylesterase
VEGALGDTALARGGGTNTINGKTVPIIFVPGVMGSRLMRPTGDDYWDPDHASVMVPLLAASATIEGIMLNAATSAVVMTDNPDSISDSDQVARFWGGVAWGFYGNALTTLQDASNWGGNICNVYACGYDWRQSNADSGAALQSRIQQVLQQEDQATKVILVTHSMGGLVARWACQNGAAGSVLGVVHVVQPAVGAVVAYRRYKTGAQSGMGDGNPVFVRILGNTAFKYQRVTHGLLGPAQLLPSNSHPASPYNSTHWLTWDNDLQQSFPWPPSNIYDTYRDASGRVGLFCSADDGYIAGEIGKCIDSAESFHAGLVTWFHDPTHVIAVNGHETDVGVDLSNETHMFGDDTAEVNTTLLHLSRTTYTAGDGTVPIGSQTVLAVPQQNQRILANAPEHADVFGSSDVMSNVIACINLLLPLA